MSHRCAVCGKEIDAGQEVARVEEKEQIYYFCSDDCFERFEQEPEEFDTEWGEKEDVRQAY